MALMALCAAASGQQAATASSATSPASTDKPEAARKEEAQVVTVTATRRAERLQDVPLSVTAVGNEQLNNAGVVRVQDIANAISGVTFGSSPQDAGFRVRGAGTLGGFSSSSEQPVGVVIDGVVFGLPPVLESMADVERIEVLKGPQGTQFGKNASSGVVSVVTKRPRLGKFEGDFEASYGSLNERNLSAVLNVPLGDAVAARVVLFDRAHDGYVENITRGEKWDGRHSFGARAKLLFKASAAVDVLLSADFARVGIEGPEQPWTLRKAPASLAGAFTALGITPGPENLKSAEGEWSYNDTQSQGLSAEVNLRLGEYTLTSVTARRERDFVTRYAIDARPQTVFAGGGFTNSTQDSQELRITSPKGTLEYVAGAYWSKLVADNDTSAYLQPAMLGAPQPPAGVFVSITSGVNRTHTDTTSAAVFGDGKLRLGGNLALLGGVRFTRDEVSASNVGDASGTRVTPQLGPPPGFFVPATPRALQQGSVSASKASGRLGMEWKPSADLLLYATAAQGYLGPTIAFSGQSGTRSDVKPQTVDDITLGFKAQFMNRTITLNGSAFHDRYKNLQLGVFRQATNEFVTENAGGMKSRGFELDASVRFASGLSGRASLTYVDAKFTDYVTQCPATGVTSRCFTQAGSTTSLYQAAGDVVPGAPKVTATAGLDYGMSIGDYLLDASVNVSHRSKTAFGVGELEYVQPAYQLVNLAFKLAPESERWHAGLWVRNLFDKHFQSAVIGLPFAPPGGIVNWNSRDARRAVGVTVGLRF